MGEWIQLLYPHNRSIFQLLIRALFNKIVVHLARTDDYPLDCFWINRLILLRNHRLELTLRKLNEW